MIGSAQALQAGGERGSGEARWRILALAALAALIAAFGAVRLPPLDRDEARFAQATAQMLESGDFLRIRYLDEERNKKPAGSYWAQALSVGLFSDASVREIAYYRLPSIIALFIAALATGAAAARLFSPAAGVLAAAGTAAAPVALIEGMIAKADAMLLAATAIAVMLMLQIGERAARSATPQRLAPALMWVSIGAGFMIKGPVIALFIAPAMVAMVLTQKRADWQARLAPVTGAIILMLMIGPWLFAIQTATDGRFLKDSLGGDMLAKIGAGKESHGAPPLTYAALAPVLFLPLIALAPAALVHGWRMRADWRFATLLAAILAPWAIFEIAATKLPHYLLPATTALAALAAAAAEAPNLLLLRRIGAGLAVLGALALGGALLYLAATLEVGMGASAIILLAGGVALALWGAAKHWNAKASPGSIALAFASLLIFAAAFTVAPRLTPLWIAPRLSAALEAAGLDGETAIAFAGYAEPAAIFLAGPGARPTDAASAAAMRAAGSTAVIEAKALSAFAAATPKGCDAQSIATIDGYNYSKGRAVSLHVFAPCRRETR
jgi:4-amino-4-deoxy-L-arabinose transferase-like glycosyltransferase